jgi:hypothetical protein
MSRESGRDSIIDAKASGAELRALAERPGPSVQEILSWETRPVAPALCEERNDYLNEPAPAEIDRERYLSPEFYRLEAERMWS